MKKIIALCLTGILLLTGCASAPASSNASDKLQIVCTIFPLYDWTKNILGEQADHAELRLLIENGVDLHSYQPTANDMITISTCDVFIYVGGESDAWVADALQEAVNPDMVVINLMEVLGDAAKQEELVEGMQAEAHDHEAEEHDHEEEDHDHEPAELDEHIWLSLKNAQVLCNEIAAQFIAMDSAHTVLYETALANYSQQLSALDTTYQTMVDTAAIDTILVADRFPFRYLVDDYNIQYYAAFVGCSAETEASFETIAFLSQKLEDLKLDTVLTIENGTPNIAQTLVQNTQEKNQTILSLHSMQGISKTQIDEGVTYLSLMQHNFDVLSTALN